MDNIKFVDEVNRWKSQQMKKLALKNINGKEIERQNGDRR